MQGGGGAKGTDVPARVATAVLKKSFFFFCQGQPFRTTPRDHQPRTAANPHQPPTAASPHQPPTASNRQPSK